MHKRGCISINSDKSEKSLSEIAGARLFIKVGDHHLRALKRFCDGSKDVLELSREAVE